MYQGITMFLDMQHGIVWSIFYIYMASWFGTMVYKVLWY